MNKLNLDAYARGVVADEMPSSWPQNALRAQAVAVRSFALSSHAGHGFNVYDDTRSQVYAGKGSETKAPNQAVSKTSGQILRYHKQTVMAMFFPTSGGRDREHSVRVRIEPDRLPPVGQGPLRRRLPVPHVDGPGVAAAMESALSGLFSGRLKNVKVTKTGDSPRIVKAKVVGSKGSSPVSGVTLQGRLGLMSTWARFHGR